MFLHKLLRLAINDRVIRHSFPRPIKQLFRKHVRHWTLYKKTTPALPFCIAGLWGFIKNKSENEPVVTTKEILLAKADAMFDQENYKQIYDLLSNYKDSKDVEILWRLSRTLYNMSKTASDVEAKKMVFEAYDLICTAYEIQENHYAVQKWMSILLDSKSNYEGMKERIRQLYKVKEHMLRAIELNPTDATTLYMLGSWCYHVSELSWYQKKLAKLIFGDIPVSSFEEALNYFENAEKVDPNFYSHNLLMLGKTYLKLQRFEEARKYLQLTSEYPARNDEDHKAKQEALKLLSSM